MGGEAIDGPFDLADVVVDVFCDVKGDLVGDVEAAPLRFVLDDGDAGL